MVFAVYKYENKYLIFLLIGRRQGQLNGDAKAVKTNPAPDRNGKSRKSERKNSESSKNIFRIGK